MRIKAKIIGNKVWTTENLTRVQYRHITGRNVTIQNENWEYQSDNYNAKCYSYDSTFISNKKEYLFNIEAINQLQFAFREGTSLWRIPNSEDLSSLFHNAEPNSNYDRYLPQLADNLRGTYGWRNNGLNKVGFNAYPNPTVDNGGLREHEISRWWYFDKNWNYSGFSLYEEDVIAISGPYYPNDGCGLAIRLVMDLPNPRIEDGIFYV